MEAVDVELAEHFVLCDFVVNQHQLLQFFAEQDLDLSIFSARSFKLVEEDCVGLDEGLQVLGQLFQFFSVLFL